MKREDTVSTLRRTGEILMAGLVEIGRKHGYAMIASGPPAIPFLSFADDPSLRKQQRFCAEVTRRGAIFHPHHNWFLSAAHTPEDIAATLRMADEAFAVVKREEI
jgi:glutamate-1-semialdehyde 2,1-aminomutase